MLIQVLSNTFLLSYLLNTMKRRESSLFFRLQFGSNGSEWRSLQRICVKAQVSSADFQFYNLHNRNDRNLEFKKQKKNYCVKFCF